MSRAKRNWDQLVQQDGNYGLDIINGIWPGSELQTKGDIGQKGENGQKGDRGLQGSKGDQGLKGHTGDKGDKGDEGNSAYQVALDHGFSGSEVDWLNSLEGEKGEKGDLGPTPFQEWLANGNTGDFDDYLDDIKGDKGEGGEKGQKGEVASVFQWKGREGSYQDILNLPGPHDAGDVYQDAQTDDLWVWNGVEFELLSEAVEILQGEKGNKGQKGEKGEKGVGEKGKEGDKGEKGDDGLDGDKGDKGDEGLSAYDIAVAQGFVGTDSEWIASLNGEDGEDGKSAYELYADGVADPNDLLSEGEWLDSLKGDKGESASDVDTSQFYTKSQIDQIVNIIDRPENSYIFDEMTNQYSVEAGESVDFRDNDQQLPVYSPGLVQVRAGAIVSNVPLTPPFFLVNYVISSLTDPRGVDHTVLQKIYSADPTLTATWFRICQPGTATFGEWDSGGGFDPDKYYTKNQIVALIDGITFSLSVNGTEATLFNQYGQNAGYIPFSGAGGIAISGGPDGQIIIDGSALANEEKLFLGTLELGEDPTTKFPNPASGNFFVFAYEGDAPAEFDDGSGNVPTVKSGDVAYYNTTDSKWLYVETSIAGLVDVNVPDDGLLDVDKTDAKRPLLSLDPDKVITPDELFPYATWQGLAQQASERLLSSLKDVEISYTATTFSGQTFNKVEFDVSIALGTDLDGSQGQFSAVPDSNFLLIAKQDKNGRDVGAIFYNNLNASADPKQKIRVRTQAGVSAGSDGMIGYITAKAARSNWYEITFDNPAIPLLALQAPDIVIDIVTEDTAHGDILSYDSNSSTWETTAGNFVSKTGDTMTGALQIDHPAGLDMQGTSPVRTRFLDSGGNSNLEIRRNGQRRILVGTNEIVLDKIAKYTTDVSVVDDKHLSTKKYVDDQIQRDINFNNYPELT